MRFSSNPPTFKKAFFFRNIFIDETHLTSPTETERRFVLAKFHVFSIHVGLSGIPMLPPAQTTSELFRAFTPSLSQLFPTAISASTNAIISPEATDTPKFLRPSKVKKGLIQTASFLTQRQFPDVYKICRSVINNNNIKVISKTGFLHAL